MDAANVPGRQLSTNRSRIGPLKRPSRPRPCKPLPATHTRPRHPIALPVDIQHVDIRQGNPTPLLPHSPPARPFQMHAKNMPKHAENSQNTPVFHTFRPKISGPFHSKRPSAHRRIRFTGLPTRFRIHRGRRNPPFRLLIVRVQNSFVAK